jgi:hypothetical protein
MEKEMKIMLFDKIRKNPSLLMILCCALPIIVVLSLSYLKVLGSWGYYALFLLFPLGHILMFKKAMPSRPKKLSKKLPLNLNLYHEVALTEKSDYVVVK